MGEVADYHRTRAKEEARREVARAALRAAAECWPDGGEGEALERLDTWTAAVDAFDHALARYVALADA